LLCVFIGFNSRINYPLSAAVLQIPLIEVTFIMIVVAIIIIITVVEERIERSLNRQYASIFIRFSLAAIV